MKIAKGSIRIFPKMKRGTAEKGVQLYWLTAAGVLLVKIRGKRKRSECLMNNF